MCARVSLDMVAFTGTDLSSSRSARVRGRRGRAAYQRAGHTGQVFALEVAPQRCDLLPGFQFAPDRAMQGHVQLREAEAARGVVELDFAVDDALCDVVAHQQVQDIPLDLEDLAGKRV